MNAARFTRYGEDSEETDSGDEGDGVPAAPKVAPAAALVAEKKQKKQKKKKKKKKKEEEETKATTMPAAEAATAAPGSTILPEEEDAMAAFLDGEEAALVGQWDAEAMAARGEDPAATVDSDGDDVEDDGGVARAAMFADFFGSAKRGTKRRAPEREGSAAAAPAVATSAAADGSIGDAPKKKKKKKAKKKKKKPLAPGEVELTQAEKKALHESKRTKGKKEAKRAKRREVEADQAFAETSGVASAMAASAARDKERKAGEKGEKRVKKKWSAYNVFVGQLPYSATQAMVRAHFEAHGVEVMAVRMRFDRDTGKFMGTAFVETTCARGQAKALRLHHSNFTQHVEDRHAAWRGEEGGADDDAQAYEEQPTEAIADRKRGEEYLPKGEGDGAAAAKADKETYEGEDNPYRGPRKKKARPSRSQSKGALQKQGRIINVERTVGGGGKGTARREKLGMLREEQGGFVRSEVEALLDAKVKASEKAPEGLRRSDVDERTVDALCSFPRKAAVAILDEFANTVDERVKNRPAWLMGMLTKYRDKLGRGEDLFTNDDESGGGGQYGSNTGRYGDERRGGGRGRGKGGKAAGRGRGSGAAEFQQKRKKHLEGGHDAGRRGTGGGGRGGGRGGGGRGGGRGGREKSRGRRS